jgi:hypothetical protein
VELHQIKKLLHSKVTINRVKRQPKEWKETFASYSSYGGLISRIYEELKKLYPKGQII